RRTVADCLRKYFCVPTVIIVSYHAARSRVSPPSMQGVQEMKARLFGLGPTVLVLSLAALLVATFASAQNAASQAKPKCVGCSPDGNTTPRTADGHPDFSGLWNNGLVGGAISRDVNGSVLFDFGGGPRDPAAQALNLAPAGR